MGVKICERRFAFFRHFTFNSTGSSTWEQRGADIIGESAGDRSGWSVALSSDGSVVAIGAPYNDSNGINTGHVRVYEWNSTGSSNWEQRGSDIDGENTWDGFGYSVALSSDGYVVAIGAKDNAGNGVNSGHVRVYEWNSTSASTWEQRGSDINGEAAGDLSGMSVSLSSDGSVVAIGAPHNDGNEVDDYYHSGHVRIYEWNNTDWHQKGSDIDGHGRYDGSGYSVSLSIDGTIVAIGATGSYCCPDYYNGHVRVYEWNATGTSTWDQRGTDIEGEVGFSVSLSSDGTVVAVGSQYNDDNGFESGQVRVYEWNLTGTYTWDQKGMDINGTSERDYLGWSVSLSGDGTHVAIGAPFNDANGTNSGHVRIFEYSSRHNPTVPPGMKPSFSPSFLPSMEPRLSPSEPIG